MLLLTVLAFSCKQEKTTETKVDPLAQHYDSLLWPFYHGVASGDPLPDRVIIWTRVTPKENETLVNVLWELAEDAAFTSIYKSDSTTTSIGKDFTVKIDVDALKPGQTYYYRFKAFDRFLHLNRIRSDSSLRKKRTTYVKECCID